jgi:hypothetical protein
MTLSRFILERDFFVGIRASAVRTVREANTPGINWRLPEHFLPCYSERITP